jgi:hypothetical protein
MSHDYAGAVLPYGLNRTARRATGRTHVEMWDDFLADLTRRHRAQAEAVRARGETAARRLTFTGETVQYPRFSRDGTRILFFVADGRSHAAIRAVAPGGGTIDELFETTSASPPSPTPGGDVVVERGEPWRTFYAFTDLFRYDSASGDRVRLTEGARAREPDVSPDGRWVAFVRRHADRSELALVPLAGGAAADLTRSAPGTQWSTPRFSPNGAALVAARWLEGGTLDLVLVDAASGAATPLTTEAAREVEPDWSPDGSHVVFRSDRDGISNLYALRLADRALLRVTRVLGGAFAPAVSRDGARVAFANYAARGYDVHLMDVDWDALPAAKEVEAAAPRAARPAPGAPKPLPEPSAARARRYRPLPAMLPRFWAPYAARNAGEWLYGVATAGLDPLLRHAYGLTAYRGTETERGSLYGFYQYDRWLPTFQLSGRDTKEPASIQERDGSITASVERTREVGLRATFPLERAFRRSQNLSFAWRFRRETLEGAPELDLDLGGVEVAWSLASVRRYPYSVAPVEGWRLRLGWLGEDPAFGSDVTLNKVTADARAHFRVLGEEDGLALRVGGGATIGRPSFERSYAVGGFPDGGSFDVVSPNFAVLRGYADDAFRGRNFLGANAEWRFPLAHPQRGWRSLPAFARHLHGELFVDAASAWSGRFRIRDVKTGVGVALGADFVFGHALPVTLTAGVARGLAAEGETRAYFRTGLSF